MLCDGKPLADEFVQTDGLNPHGTGSYIVVYEEKLGDFVLDFDYKLTKGCNSGVFIRVGDLKDPVYTGLEIALDDTTGTGMHDSGAFYDLVAPKTNAQKPAGEWNHMTITAKGPKIAVVLNGEEVSTIDLDQWNEPGKRPDGSDHKFSKVAIGSWRGPATSASRTTAATAGSRTSRSRRPEQSQDRMRDETGDEPASTHSPSFRSAEVGLKRSTTRRSPASAVAAASPIAATATPVTAVRRPNRRHPIRSRPRGSAVLVADDFVAAGVGRMP